MYDSIIEDSSRAHDPVGAQLDTEIEALQAQIASLKSLRKLQASTILSSRATQSTLQRLRSSQKSYPSQTNPETDLTPLITTSTAQRAHNRQNLYRACASITTFRILDPDPNAVDNGNVLGIRFDAMSTGKFVKPYYVMLNKPFRGSNLLRIHRHTIPPCIPLAFLADRHLPHGKGATASVEERGSRRQDLQRFARALRREIVGYHNRVSVIKNLRKEFRLDEKPSSKGKEKEIERVITDITAADAEAKQIRMEWVDGRIGRTIVGDKGEVVKCAVIGQMGRDRDVERRILSKDGNNGMIGIAERLKDGIY